MGWMGACVLAIGVLLGLALSLLHPPPPPPSIQGIVRKIAPPRPKPAVRIGPEGLEGDENISLPRGKSRISAEDAPHLKDRSAHVSTGRGIAQPAGKEATAEPLPFALHLESFRDPATAEKRVAFLKQAGLNAFSVRVDLAEKGVFYRVFAGRTSSLAEAEELNKYLRERYGFSEGWIMDSSRVDR